MIPKYGTVLRDFDGETVMSLGVLLFPGNVACVELAQGTVKWDVGAVVRVSEHVIDRVSDEGNHRYAVQAEP